IVNSAAIAAAPDGGLWLVRATTGFVDPDVFPGEVRVGRFTSAGLPEAGWDALGVSLAPFRGDLLYASYLWGPVPGMALVAIANDGGAGAFVIRTEVADDGYGGVALPAFRLSRVGADGAGAPGWPTGGLTLGIGSVPF